METYTVLAEQNHRYPIGITIIDKKIHVSVVSAGKRVSLVLFEHGQEEPFLKVPMDPKNRKGDVWNLTLEGRWPKGTMYCFEID